MSELTDLINTVGSAGAAVSRLLEKIKNDPQAVSEIHLYTDLFKAEDLLLEAYYKVLDQLMILDEEEIIE